MNAIVRGGAGTVDGPIGVNGAAPRPQGVPVRGNNVRLSIGAPTGIAEGRLPRRPALGARSETSDGYFWVRMTAVLMIGPVALPSRTRRV